MTVCVVAVAGCGGEQRSDTHAGGATIATFEDVEVRKAEFDAAYRLELLKATNAATRSLILGERKPKAVRFDEEPEGCAADIRGAASAAAAKRLESVSDAELGSYCRTIAAKVKQTAVDDVLASRITIAEAKKAGLSATDEEVQQRLRVLYTQLGGRGEPRELPALTGARLDTLRGRARVGVLEQKLSEHIAGRNVQVTDVERRAYLGDNRKRFDAPERRDIRLIETATRSGADAALRDLRNGQPFADVVRRRSINARSKPDGGMIRYVPDDGLPPALSGPIFRAKLGAVVGPVRSTSSRGGSHESYFVVRVAKVTPAGVPSFAKLRAALTPHVRNEKKATAVEAWQARVRDRWRPKITCAPGYVLTDLCGNRPLRSGSTVSAGPAPSKAAGEAPATPE